MDPNRPKKSLAAVAYVVLTCVIAISISLSGCSSTTAGSADAPGAGKGKGKGKGDAAVPVVVTTVSQRDVPIDITVVGNIEAYSTISIKSQISGQLTEVFFREGEFVKKNDKLFTIDPRPLEAQLAQLEANLAKDIALASQAEANLARDAAQELYARTQAGRYQKLYDEKVASKEQVEQMLANADALTQAVQADKASIQSAKAQATADRAGITNAKVQLSYTSIPSPIDGRTGNLSIKLGNFVSAGTVELVAINQVEPIYVTFSVPEARLGDIKHYMANGKLAVICRPQDGDNKQEQGQLTFVDNSVDMTTGTIKLKGTFPNTDHRMWPGQFVNVVLRLTTQPHATVVPNQAVQTGQDGQFVYVVKEDRTVDARKVTVGPRVDQDLVINSGLEPGETIVTEGQLRLAPGSRVQVGDGRGKGGGGRGRPAGS